MTEAKWWMSYTIRAALFFGLFYAWQFMSMEPAGRLLNFWVWFIIVVTMVAVCSSKNLPHIPDPAGGYAARWILTVASVASLAAVDMQWTAAFLTLAAIFNQGLRDMIQEECALEAQRESSDKARKESNERLHRSLDKLCQAMTSDGLPNRKD